MLISGLDPHVFRGQVPNGLYLLEEWADGLVALVRSLSKVWVH